MRSEFLRRPRPLKGRCHRPRHEQRPGVYVLDREMDADHNRCVITLAGDPEAVGEAAILGAGKALELIDMNDAHRRASSRRRHRRDSLHSHRRSHSGRLRRSGPPRRQRNLETLSNPHLFLRSRRHPPRSRQSRKCSSRPVRRLREELKKNHERQPDIGEPKLHPTAGVTVVGARKFLVAYNVNLNTPDISIANKIAKAIRFSSGGLRYVKSMGVDLKARNLAQVSINLTDFENTPMHRVYEMVKREAARYGVMPVGSEIVGLVPKKAIEMAADYFLQLEDFSPSQVFENKLGSRSLWRPGGIKGSHKFASLAQPFLDAVSEPTPTPGGGSVSAFAAAAAAALGQMVACLSRKKKSQILHVDKLSATWTNCAESPAN